MIREIKKAETKLIKLRIVKKIYDGLELNKNEQTYLEKWKKNEIPRSYRITKRALKSLQKEDKDLLESKNNISIHTSREYPLSEFILEFSQFFDDKFVEIVNLYGNYRN